MATRAPGSVDASGYTPDRLHAIRDSNPFLWASLDFTKVKAGQLESLFPKQGKTVDDRRKELNPPSYYRKSAAQVLEWRAMSHVQQDSWKAQEAKRTSKALQRDWIERDRELRQKIRSKTVAAEEKDWKEKEWKERRRLANDEKQQRREQRKELRK